MGLVRQLPSRSEPQQAKPQPAQMGLLAIQRRSERSLPLLVAGVVVAAEQPQAISMVDPVEGSGGRVECRRALRQSQAGCRADQLLLAG